MVDKNVIPRMEANYGPIFQFFHEFIDSKMEFSLKKVIVVEAKGRLGGQLSQSARAEEKVEILMAERCCSSYIYIKLPLKE